MDDTPHAHAILETPQLNLRYQSADDIAALTDLWADPRATLYLGGPRDRAWLQAAFAETARDLRAEPYDLWPVVEKETGRVVGHCGLLDKEVDGRPEIELVYIFAPDAWENGYATEMAAALLWWALEARGLPRLIALIEPENAASERVAVKIGMRLEKETVRPGARGARCTRPAPAVSEGAQEMQPGMVDDLLEMLNLYVTSAAVGAAMELGLFWLLAERPRRPAEVAEALGIPGGPLRVLAAAPGAGRARGADGRRVRALAGGPNRDPGCLQSRFLGPFWLANSANGSRP